MLIIRYLYQQKVVTAITSPISKICQYLSALLCVDTYLYVFNDGSMIAQEVVIKAQRLLNSWNEVLKYTRGELKLSKCHWTLQYYLWQNGTYAHTSSTVSTINIRSESFSTTTDHIPSGKIRIIIGVQIMPSNDSVDIVPFYQDKIKYCILRLKGTNLNP